ncbi:MAG: S8 family serine peptidase [Verrucomicrobia bacterium]|nr:S8 family serine peptidase [Verrucomicrobiota bacterium]
MVRFSGTVGLILFVTALFAHGAEPKEKTIHLRNERIITPAKAPQAANKTARKVSGLFVIQFTGPIHDLARKDLQQQNVKLLRFVPEDSFVARLHNADLNVIEALPFVRWVGAYEPGHKIYSSLRTRAAARGVQENFEVRILLSPDAGPQEVARTRGMMNRFERESVTRFGRILDGTVNTRQLTALAESDATLWIEPARPMRLFDEISTKITAGEDGNSGTFAWVHQLGYDGAGVTVAVADSGLQEGDAETMHPDLAGRVTAFFHYGTLTDAADEHSHGTHVTGIVAGNATTGETDEDGFLYGLGVAPGAQIVAQRLFDGNGAYHSPPSFEKLTRDAVQSGAEIGSNSWGDDTQGRYDLTAAEFDALVRDADSVTPGDQPYILEFSAGNAGPGAQTIGTPAVAKNVIATGATENDRFEFFIYESGSETMADFSSRGPCEDGRIKPDVVAPGTWIASLRSSLANDDNAWAPISNNYLYQGGTSQAGPHVSGAAALFVQYYRENITNATPSPALVKAALINSAVDIDDGESTGPIPNNDEGWGRVDLAELIDSTRQYEFVDQSVSLTTGQVFEKRILVGSADEPLRITLVYSDVPGFPATIPALVNDLDLEVIAPNGAVYRGNQFDEGESVANAGAFDNVNNVEAVYLLEPVPGEYVVRIHARNVPEDARIDTPQVDQDFALVISAEIPLPGAGVLFFNRKSYSAPAVMVLKLIDFDLAGQSSVTVQVRSSTESAGETYTLFADGATGAFTNSIQTITGSPTIDGKLQIAHGDLIEATYLDASPVGTRIATARADLLPPILVNVGVTNRFGRTLVSWQTDEPSDTLVYYGTSSALSLSVTNLKLTLFHEIALENLLVGETYYFIVSSGDEAGNRATNNNGGALFSFVAEPASVILLVDSYKDPFFSIPPLSGYTAALNEVGVSYEIWDATTPGSSPTLNDLRAFEAVIWRVPEFDGSLTLNERNALTSYLAEGGSLFISSMEALTRLDEVGGTQFRTNVLRVMNYAEDVGADLVYGNNDPITSGVDVVLDYTPYEDPWKDLLGIPTDISDTITIAPGASPILFEPFGGVVGLRYPKVGQDSNGRVVFLSFPIDAVPLSGAAPNTRANLLRNIISFLVPGVNGIGTIALDRSAYTIPSLVTVEVADSDLIGTGSITVMFSSDTETTAKSINLQETVRPGLFRGFISLVSHTNGFSPNVLRVQNGDIIVAEYSDASDGGIVRAIAEVDTTPPIISNVQVTPEYQDAVIEWTTSKPTDALVQFGESAFLNRTAYNPDFSESPFVTLTGLQSDKTYFFQVVSRDQAGNTTVDNNSGALYSFRTLKPFDAPWSDNLENGGTNWIVIDGEPGTTWRLGTPNNGWESSAHSGLNAWGSNLDGAAIDLGDTSLIGPAVSLAGGTQATLKFWHSYDFTERSELDIIEFGSVQISTNNGSAWIELATLFEFSDGWEEVEIDLTPYAGRVVRIGFYYGLFSLDNVSRPGWLIDDISMTVSSPNTGTVQVTNNLAQASFALTGPFAQNGSGWNTIFPNAPTGTYVVSYGAVPFYESPSAQTNVLSSMGSLVFTGNYTFVDANNNGISDAWEQSFFGEVSTNRTAQTDTDLDGMSDYAEFIAGTIPTDPTSVLRFYTPGLFPDGSIELGWTTVPGRVYQLQGSTDTLSWLPVSAWISATSTNLSLARPPHTNGAPYLFRIEVKP